MTTLYALLASDVCFALALWLIVRDHRKKMDAIYKKYDKRTKNDRLRLDK